LWKGSKALLIERQQVIDYCLSYDHVYEDYPFKDSNWCVIRHEEDDKIFAWIFEKDGYPWVNVKCDPEWLLFWRNAFESVIPAFHLNKNHWNSIILDGSIPDKDIQIMIGNSYDLTMKKDKTRTAKSDTDIYPINLLKDINVNEYSKVYIEYAHLTEDQVKGLEYALSQMRKRETEMVLLRYRDKKTFQAIAEIYNRSDSRVSQIIQKVLRKLRHPSRMIYIVEGYEAYCNRMNREHEEFRLIYSGVSEERRSEILQLPIEDLQLTVRSYNALKRAGICTLADLVERSKDVEVFVRIRNFGKASRVEVVSKMLHLGLIDESHPVTSMIGYSGMKNS
jgi:RNA polymerase sigma factor (sigma-70 family)